jgi:hypothetical protein
VENPKSQRDVDPSGLGAVDGTEMQLPAAFCATSIDGPPSSILEVNLYLNFCKPLRVRV